MKKIIITAANSFIGYRLCHKMVENGWYVYAVVRNENSDLKGIESLENLTIIYETMQNYSYLSMQIQEKCDVGVLLAWDGTRGKDRDNVQKQKDNYVYSMEGVDSFIKLGCKTIVTAGSQAEYGPWIKKKKVKETDCCNPNTEYGKYKLKLYQDALKICEEKGVRLIEPRFFSLYGPDDFAGTMIVSMLRNMLKDHVCELTQCIQMWDFLYIDDAIGALYKLICSESARGVYNFGSGVSRELKEYVILMRRLTESKSRLLFGKVPYPATGMVNTNPSVEKLEAEVDWRPEVTFEDGIKMVIEAQKCVEK